MTTKERARELRDEIELEEARATRSPIRAYCRLCERVFALNDMVSNAQGNLLCKTDARLRGAA